MSIGLHKKKQCLPLKLLEPNRPIQVQLCWFVLNLAVKLFVLMKALNDISAFLCIWIFRVCL